MPGADEPISAEEPTGAEEHEQETGTADGHDGEPAEGADRQARAPWHFKVIVVGTVVYLGYRLYQGITWLVHHV